MNKPEIPILDRLGKGEELTFEEQLRILHLIRTVPLVYGGVVLPETDVRFAEDTANTQTSELEIRLVSWLSQDSE